MSSSHRDYIYKRYATLMTEAEQKNKDCMNEKRGTKYVYPSLSGKGSRLRITQGKCKNIPYKYLTDAQKSEWAKYDDKAKCEATDVGGKYKTYKGKAALKMIQNMPSTTDLDSLRQMLSFDVDSGKFDLKIST